MKKIILTLSLILMLTGSAFAFLNNEKGYISVYMDEKAEVLPDTASIVFEVTNENKDLNLANNENKTKANKAINAIKSNLSENDTIETKGFNVVTRYNYKDGIRTFVSYEITNSFVVKVKDVQKIGKIIDIALQNGANRVSNLNFSLSNRDEICNDLIKKASLKASKRADVIAKSLNLKVSKVKSANLSCNGGEVYRNSRVYMADSYALKNSSSPEPIESNLINIQATFDGQFFVK